MNKIQKKEGGFTIIEVVLVLAIAGLIFLIVFLAVPALQRSQRDTARKNDLSRFMAQINSYQANNKGCVPSSTAIGTCPTTTMATFVTQYLKAGGDTFSDPTTGNDYTVTQTATAPAAAGAISYQTSSTCTNGAVTAITPAQPRQVAAAIYLEGTAVPYCQEN